jgi:hypothetical protein
MVFFKNQSNLNIFPYRIAVFSRYGTSVGTLSPFCTIQLWTRIYPNLFSSVADPDPNPDPPDPRVFGPPGSGSGSTSQRYGSGSGSCSGSRSGSFYHHAKIVKKNLDSSYFVTLFEFLFLKNDVNVASKSHKQKKLC